jgi:diaminohydroxyphosphoribosylaminopyrimidine deaminase/5-amino-6-(5-phosphoribosylamino)uracil reductase
MSSNSISAAKPAQPPFLDANAFDIANMQLALAMGKRGLGRCWPNPAVGAVIVDPHAQRIVSCAATSPGGRPHAEALALAKAGDAARGATLYVTLEPCSHWGATPPCADATIAAGIARVVYGVADPDPRVSGAGLERLRAHGIEVVETSLAREARWLTLGHILRVAEHRPFVQIKLAVDANGNIPAGDGAPVWITGEEARAYGHILRAKADAILVGHGTVSADNPQLTCRLPGLEARSPVRVILAQDASLPKPTKMLETLDIAPVWVFCGADAPPANIAWLEAAGAVCIPLSPQTDGRLPLAEVLRALAERGITRLLVEGGPTVAESFFDAGVADEVFIFQSAKKLQVSSVNMPAGLAKIAQHAHYSTVEARDFGSDRLTAYRRAAVWPHDES